MINKLGIIVDGQGDFAALKARFRDRFEILKADGPRDRNVTPAQIVGAARKQVAILKALKYSEILIVLDYESRSISYEKFLKELRVNFQKLLEEVTIHVAVPNVRIENWYLADIEYLSKKKKFLKRKLKQKNYEGKNGRAVLTKLLQQGVIYNETIHGAQMFSVIRFKVARAHSQSFDAFYEIIKRYL